MSEAFAIALLGALVGIILREAWVIRQTLADEKRRGRNVGLARFFLSTLGKRVAELLADGPGAWTFRGMNLEHRSGLVLDLQPGGTFDIADPGGVTDYMDELPALDRWLLWPKVRDLRHRLRYPELLG